MVRAPRRTPGLLLAVLTVGAVGLAACDGDGSSSPSTSVPPVSSSTVVGSSVPSVPYEVYSPPPPPNGPITKGYLRETLTLDVGDGTLRLTVHSTAMNSVAAIENEPRHFSVWLTVENPSDAPWRGDLGMLAHVDDDFGGDVAADPSPAPGDYSMAAKRLGYSNRNLVRPVTIPAGGSVDGVLIFQMYGGNRVVYITIDSPSEGEPVVWETNFGVF